MKKTQDYFEKIKLAEIEPNSFNVREQFEEKSIQELAKSMEIDGLINPLTIRVVGKNKFEIICGERRYRAALLLGWETIDAYIKELTVEDAKRLCLIENIQRENISVMEEAKALKRLYELTGDIDELIARVNKSESYVRSHLRLNNLIPEIVNRLEKEEISFGVASVLCAYSADIQQDIHSRFLDKDAYNNWLSLGKDEIKKRVESFYTTQLDQYKFDLKECRECVSNAANFTLFSDRCGKCMNKTCLDEKNATYLLAKAIKIKQADPLVVLCTSFVRATNKTVIERLKLQEFEIQDNAQCQLYPQEPQKPVFSEGVTEEEKEEVIEDYQKKMQKYTNLMDDLKKKEGRGELTKFAVIGEKDIDFQYQLHTKKNETEELQKQLTTLAEKDKRNQELKIINTVKDTKAVIFEQHEIPSTKAISVDENKYFYYFLLEALASKHFQYFDIPNSTHYLSDKQKKEILDRGLSEEQKAMIQRDYLARHFNSAFGNGITSEFFIAFAKEHFPEEVTKIEKKYTEVYHKRQKKLKEQSSMIEKELKKRKKLPKKDKKAA